MLYSILETYGESQSLYTVAKGRKANFKITWVAIAAYPTREQAEAALRVLEEN
jgi:hypothetical protein